MPPPPSPTATKAAPPTPTPAGNQQQEEQQHAIGGAALDPGAGGLDLCCLDGVRALSSLLVLASHSTILWLALPTVDPPTAPGLLRRTLLGRLGTHGIMGVDIFFILTALLAAWRLVPELESAGSATQRWAAVRTYWRTRLRRLLPSYVAANVLGLLTAARDHGTTDPDLAACHMIGCWWACPHRLWANFLFINNLLGFNICGIHFWQIAVNVQFYAAFPLLLLALRPGTPGFRRRVLLAAGAAAAACAAHRQALARREDLGLPYQYGNSRVDPTLNGNLLKQLLTLYLPTPARVANLAAGVALGCLLRWPAAVAALRQRRGWLALATATLQASWYLLSWRAPVLGGSPAEAWPPQQAQLFLAHVWYGGLLPTATIAATLLCLVLGAGPVYRAAARLLGSPPLRALSSLSYQLNLTHLQWQRCAVALLLPGGGLTALAGRAPLTALRLATALTAAAALPAAALQYQLLERRPRQKERQ